MTEPDISYLDVLDRGFLLINKLFKTGISNCDVEVCSSKILLSQSQIVCLIRSIYFTDDQSSIPLVIKVSQPSCSILTIY